MIKNAHIYLFGFLFFIFSHGQLAAKDIQDSPGEVFLALLSTHVYYPQINAVEAYAKLHKMKQAPQEILYGANAKTGYVAKSKFGFTVIFSNDYSPFTITVFENFDAKEALREISEFASIKKMHSFKQLGQAHDVYELLDNGESLGFVLLTYGVAKKIKGIGTLAYTQELPKFN